MITFERKSQVVPDADALNLWTQAVDREEFLLGLRARGAYQVESIRHLRQLGGISLEEAKNIVHFSQAWADRREENERLQDIAIQACDELMREGELQRIAS